MCSRARTSTQLYTRMHTFSLAGCFETHRLYRGAYSVHADSCTFLFILRLHPRGGLGAHQLMGPTFSCRASPSPPLSLSLYFSRPLEDLEVNDEDARGRFCLSSELPFSLGGFPLRCWWNLTTRELPGTPLSVTATSATLRCSLLTQLLTADCGFKPIPCNRELREF